MKTAIFAFTCATLLSFTTWASSCENGVSNRHANDANKKLQTAMGLNPFLPTVNTPECDENWIRAFLPEADIKPNHDFGGGCGVRVEFPDEESMKSFFELYLHMNHGKDQISVFDLFADIAVPFCGVVRD